MKQLVAVTGGFGQIMHIARRPENLIYIKKHIQNWTTLHILKTHSKLENLIYIRKYLQNSKTWYISENTFNPEKLDNKAHLYATTG